MLGKFAGAVTILLLMTAGTLIDVVPLYLFGNPEGMTILSRLHRVRALRHDLPGDRPIVLRPDAKPDVAALITVAVLLALWFIANASVSRRPMRGGICLATSRFHAISRNSCKGWCAPESVIFYLVVCAIVLVLNTSYLRWQR